MPGFVTCLRANRGTMAAMDRERVRAFAIRDYEAVAREKAHYWAERIERLGPAEGMRAAELLREHVRAVRPEWPTPDDRAADLAAHVHLCALLSRASRALSPR